MTRARDLANLADGTEFTADDHTKLDAIEASADQTDTANVTAAGALMDSELTNLAAVKAINQSLVTTASPTFAGLNTTSELITKGGVSIDSGSSTGPEFSRGRDQNLKLKGASGGDVGITGYNAANTWAFQLYGHAPSSDYGFLEANWGAWDTRKVVNGRLELNGSTAYYLQPETTSRLNNLMVGGIDFGTSGASAETLDDYERGTFQMSILGVSGGTVGSGVYVKIGNMVHFQYYSGTVTVSGSGQPRLSGLPFTAIDPLSSSGSAYPTFVASHNNYVSNSSSGYINLGTTELYFTANNSSGGTAIQSGSRYVMVSGSYYAS